MHDDNFKKGQRGEFRGDFTRDTFDPFRHFSRVLMQQGRVQLDADWNEQVSIFNHYMRTMVADLIGPHGTPCTEDGTVGKGFKITSDDNSTFKIEHGNYYVNGVLCENDFHNESSVGLLYTNQPDYPLTDEEKELKTGSYLVYLDVWERHIGYVEDDYMREKALGGPDTASRSRIVWQVLLQPITEDSAENPQEIKNNYQVFLGKLSNPSSKSEGLLRVRTGKKNIDSKAPCLTAPDSSYRGTENQLYRVEIHKAGTISSGTQNNNDLPTFKWSRENGSVIFPITEYKGDNVISLESLDCDTRYGLKSNDWVEIIDDDYILRNREEKLLQIEEVDSENLQVILKEEPEALFGTGTNNDKHPYLRRWDQKQGEGYGLNVKDQNGGTWISLEEGLEVQLVLSSPDENSDTSKTAAYQHQFKKGDYWLIPARTNTGDIEWPGSNDFPLALPPHGVEHHYAPLAIIKVDEKGKVTVPSNNDLRRKINKLWK